MNRTVLLETEKQKNSSVVNSIVFTFLMYILFFRQIYSYFGMPFTAMRKGSFVYEQMSLSNTITIFFAMVAVFCVLFLFFNTRFLAEGTYLITSIALIAGVCLWSAFAIKDVGLGNILYSSTPPYVYITALMFCVGMKEDLFKIFLKHSKILGVLSILVCVISFVLFFKSHRGCVLADSSALRHYIQAFWLLCIYSFCSENTNKVFVYSCIAFFAVMSFSFSSRSWLIQSVIWLVAYTYFSQKKKKSFASVKTILISAILIGIIFVVIQNLFPDLFTILIEKISPKTTRARQYMDLFAQTTFGDYIIGKGYTFSYYSSTQGEIYNYIDNAYLFMLIRYGLLIGLSYPLMFIIPLFKSRFSKESMPLIMWLMALGGLSIFCATIIDLKSVVLPVVAGRCMYLVSQRKK